jgi:hypothetical protein
MLMYETVVRTSAGEIRAQMLTPTVQEAKKLFEQRH